MMNGDLFHDIIVFSPGFARTLNRRALPRIFIAHGNDDPILPVERARQIVERLSADGYQVRYQEFEGGHVVQRDVAESALHRFAN
jgi:predicted esterase